MKNISKSFKAGLSLLLVLGMVLGNVVTANANEATDKKSAYDETVSGWNTAVDNADKARDNALAAADAAEDFADAATAKAASANAINMDDVDAKVAAATAAAINGTQELADTAKSLEDAVNGQIDQVVSEVAVAAATVKEKAETASSAAATAKTELENLKTAETPEEYEEAYGKIVSAYNTATAAAVEAENAYNAALNNFEAASAAAAKAEADYAALCGEKQGAYDAASSAAVTALAEAKAALDAAEKAYTDAVKDAEKVAKDAAEALDIAEENQVDLSKVNAETSLKSIAEANLADKTEAANKAAKELENKTKDYNDVELVQNQTIASNNIDKSAAETEKTRLEGLKAEQQTIVRTNASYVSDMEKTYWVGGPIFGHSTSDLKVQRKIVSEKTAAINDLNAEINDIQSKIDAGGYNKKYKKKTGFFSYEWEEKFVPYTSSEIESFKKAIEKDNAKIAKATEEKDAANAVIAKYDAAVKARDDAKKMVEGYDELIKAENEKIGKANKNIADANAEIAKAKKSMEDAATASRIAEKNQKAAKDALDAFVFSDAETLKIDEAKLAALKKAFSEADNDVKEIATDADNYIDAISAGIWDTFIGLFTGDTYERLAVEHSLEAKYRSWKYSKSTYVIIKGDNGNKAVLLKIEDDTISEAEIDIEKLATYEMTFDDLVAKDAALRAAKAKETEAQKLAEYNTVLARYEAAKKALEAENLTKAELKLKKAELAQAKADLENIKADLDDAKKAAKEAEEALKEAEKVEKPSNDTPADVPTDVPAGDVPSGDATQYFVIDNDDTPQGSAVVEDKVTASKEKITGNLPAPSVEEDLGELELDDDDQALGTATGLAQTGTIPVFVYYLAAMVLLAAALYFRRSFAKKQN